MRNPHAIRRAAQTTRWPSYIAPSAIFVLLVLSTSHSCLGQPLAEPKACIYPEQRQIQFRAPGQLEPFSFQSLGTVPTVTNVFGQVDEDEDYGDIPGKHLLALDEAIQIALANAEVIRVLGITSASSTGQTIYDPAITNTRVDQERATFDPNLMLQNNYFRSENPGARLNPGAPSGATIDALDVDTYRLGLDVTQRKSNGGTIQFGVDASPTRTAIPGLALNPQTPTTVDFGYTQPLLRGRGQKVNLAPIVIARIDTERSYYQLKDAVQELVRSVIAGYWGLVFARTDLWARRQQVRQLQITVDFLEAQSRVGSADLGDKAQADVSLANFQANLISVEADLLNREAAFFSVLGWDPDSPLSIAPSTPPIVAKTSPNWEELLAIAQVCRPDLIEAKLTIEADRQRLLVADNNALPQLDAVSLFQTNGLGGRSPSGTIIRNEPFQFNNLQVGLNLSLPVGQRATRALLRQEQLALVRDQALLRQQFLTAKHSIAQNLRNLETFYAQYDAFKKVRSASRFNVNRQFELFRIGGVARDRITVIDVLVAVTDWGNAVSSEALALTQYNAELAALQRQIGTILENHGIVFYEEQFLSKGPGPKNVVSYPESQSVSGNKPRYEDGTKPSEDSFDLKSPVPDLKKPYLGRPKATSGDRRPLELSPLERPRPGEPLPDPAHRLPRPTEPPGTDPGQRTVPQEKKRGLPGIMDRFRELFPGAQPDG